MLTSTITQTITRPADTTAYTAGDVVGASSFLLGPTGDAAGYGGQIKAVAVISSQNATTKPDLELWLFSAAVASVTADNAAFAPTDTEAATLLAIVTIPTGSFKVANAGSGTSGNSACVVTGLDLPLPPNVYGVLVVRNAYAPISSEVFTINLNVLRGYSDL